MGNFFLKTYHSIKNHKGLSISLLLLMVFVLLFLASKVNFKDDITALIPSNKETLRIQKVLKSISFTDKIIVNIEKGPNTSIDELTQYASEFTDSVLKDLSPYVKKVQGKVNDTEVFHMLDLVYEHLPLFLEERDYQAIDLKLSKDSIQRQMEQNYRTLISPSGIISKKSILKDPLGLSFIALKKLQKLGVAEDFKLHNGFLLNKEETNILLFLTPVNPSSATVENKPLSDGLYTLENKFKTKYQNNIEVSFFGAAMVAVANAQQVKNDILFTVSIAMILLLILLIVFYKKFTLPLILFAPTVFGALVAMAFLSLVREYISAISLGIGAILLGVTLDYALHILTHIRKGHSIKMLYNEVAPSIIMSSLTTASAFLCLLFLDSQALQDLGIFASVSVTGASLFALLFVPQVYVYKESVKKKTNFLEHLAAFQFHKNKWAIGLLVIGIVTSAFYYNKVTFNQDISKLNYESKALTKAKLKLEKLTDLESKSVYLSTYGEDREKVLQKNDAFYEDLRQLKEKNEIINFTSVSSLAKSSKTQKEKINSWSNFWTSKKIDSLEKNLNNFSKDLGFKESTFQNFYTWLNGNFTPMPLSDLEKVPLLSIDDYIVTDSSGTTATTLVKLNDDQFDILKDRFKDERNTLLINRKQVNESFLGTLKNDFNRLLTLSLITVLVILALFYRSLSLTLVTAIPIFLTWFLTVGIMGLLNIEFNIFNIIICSFIFGLGVDYSIFVTNGLLTEHRTGVKTLPTHKTSILLSIITTIASVGVMVFAKHPALYAISRVSLIGIFSAAFVAFTLQPQLFRLFIGNKDKRPISLRYFIHSVLSFIYFGLGGIVFSLYAWIVTKINPDQAQKENIRFHKAVSILMKSVLYTNPFVKKQVVNPHNETFEKPVMIIANHTSFLDILCIGMLHPKIIFLVNDWVYNSPIFGRAAKLAGAYPVSGGIENGELYLKNKLEQGFSFIAFPEGTRSTTNKIKRFHKGAFYLAEKLNLDLLPVLIHGNSEVLPKGSFVIRDGSITVELLPRIPVSSKEYGEDYTKKGKLVGAYFRKEFRRLREQKEGSDYWKKTLLENYRYKGDAMYKRVKTDLKLYSEIYHKIIRSISPKETIVHLSADDGQLDLLLSLDSLDRRIHTYLSDTLSREALKQNFLTKNHSKITVYRTAEEALSQSTNLLIVHLNEFELTKIKNPDIQTIILLEPKENIDLKEVSHTDFSISDQSDNFIILNKKTQH
ncbi:MMPL family transporter [Maribacter sp. MMG018]|nr:MMPL family transporter [Maribacter sp. MMG018]